MSICRKQYGTKLEGMDLQGTKYGNKSREEKGVRMMENIKEASAFIQSKIDRTPEIAMVLGSGLGVVGELLEEPVYIEYSDIPNFPVSTVVGHKGRLVFGMLEGKDVVIMQGRFHYYEGYSMQECTFPIRVFYELGIRKLVLTNAAGGVNSSLAPADLVLLEDHINIMGVSPLIGKNMDEYGTRFPSLLDVYSKEFNKKVEAEAEALGIGLKKGVYFYMTGPQYETAAEIRLVRAMGGDVVGMSTVPEAVVAAHMQMRTTGISCVTNMTGDAVEDLKHEDVMEISRQVEDKFVALVRRIVAIS